MPRSLIKLSPTMGHKREPYMIPLASNTINNRLKTGNAHGAVNLYVHENTSIQF